MPNYTAPSNRLTLAAVLTAASCALLGCSLFEPESDWECFNPDCSAADSGNSDASAGASDAGDDAASAGADASSGSGGASGTGGDAASACTACDSGLVCNELDGRCVQCLDNADCKSQAPVCTVDHRCVSCTLDRHCPSVTPACNNDNTCVGCTDSARHCGGNTPLCDSDRHECVQCLKNSDCMDSAASRCNDGACQPCTGPLHCKHLDNLSICDTSLGSGECVQCTGAQYAACGTDSITGRPFVCDSVKRKCSDQTERSSGLCGGCVSDAECPTGQLCVLQEFDSATIGYFCVWKKQAGIGGAPTSCSDARPYVQAVPDTESIDGTNAEVCTLALSTCPAHQDFRGTGCSGATPSGDAECGVDPVADGYCRLFESGPDVYRCTVGCLSDDDCKAGSTCDTLVTPQVCKF
jgi:hypothetical protein